MWGDSGLYYCIITTPDDLEGKNEDSVELLVLGKCRPSAACRSRPARSGPFSFLVPACTRVPAGCTHRLCPQGSGCISSILLLESCDPLCSVALSVFSASLVVFFFPSFHLYH